MKFDAIIYKGDDLGIDMIPIYQSSCFSRGLPLFDHLYSEYSFELMKQELDLSAKELNNYKKMINNGEYDASMIETGGQHPFGTELQLFDYLFSNYYSFQKGTTVFNTPLAEVW